MGQVEEIVKRLKDWKGQCVIINNNFSGAPLTGVLYLGIDMIQLTVLGKSSTSNVLSNALNHIWNQR